MSSTLGWRNLKTVHSQEVRRNLKPSAKCQVCGMELYYQPVFLKKGPVQIAYEDGRHGGDYLKVIYNHDHMARTRQSCIYCQPAHDIITGLKIMSAEEEAVLRHEYETIIAGAKLPGLAEVHRQSFIERALAIQEELRKAGKTT